MSATIATQQAQITEKNRLLKKQEQTLKDLRVTLQRELKIQALPNDDPSDPVSNSAQSSNAGSFRSSSPGFYNSTSFSSSSQQNHYHNHPHSNLNQSNYGQGNSHSGPAQSFS
ncbi:hypothetical protein EGW08_000534, partial [Elysia chlorotica]